MMHWSGKENFGIKLIDERFVYFIVLGKWKGVIGGLTVIFEYQGDNKRAQPFLTKLCNVKCKACHWAHLKFIFYSHHL